MEETVKQRIVAFIRHEGLSQGKFESLCGISNGYINNLKSSPTVPVLQKIVCAFPDLNLDWLVSGIGEMKKTETSSREDVSLDVNRLVSLLESNSAQLASRDRQIEKFQDQLDRILGIMEHDRGIDPDSREKQHVG